MALPYPDNLVFHYDASETDSVTITDSKVSGLADLYNSYDLTQINANRRPTLTTVDGVQCLQFGTGGEGDIHLLGSSLPLTGDATLIAKVRGNGTVINDRNGMFFKADSVGQCHFGGIGAVAGQWYESFGGAGTGFTNRTLLNIDVSSVSQGVWTTATIRRSGDTIYGGFDGTEGAGAGSIAGGWTSAYRIGQTTRNYHWNGYIAYMALYDRSLSAEEIAAVVAALESTGTTLSTGLQGWWCPSLDTSGNGTTTLTDLSGNGRNASLVDDAGANAWDTATHWVADTDNSGVRALSFDSGRWGDPSWSFAPFGPITFSYWYKATPESKTRGTGLDNSSASNRGAIGADYAGQFLWDYPTAYPASGRVSYTPPNINDYRDTWVHVLCRSGGDGGNIQDIWLNGVQVASRGSSTGASTPAAFLIGTALGSRAYSIYGLMDSMAVWDRLLTADEVSQLYNGGRSLNLLSTGATIVPQLLLRRRRLFGGLVI